jgi:serine protease Do
MEKNKKLPINLKNRLLFSLSALLIIVSLLYVAWATLQLSSTNNYDKGQIANEVEVIRIIDEQSQVIDVAEMASPAVVSIVATAEVPIFERGFHDPFEQFFPFFEEPERQEPETERIQVGAGTGFLVSSDGYIVTNRHVVEDENAQYTVFLNDEKHQGQRVEAEVLALDPSNDLAILKIDKKDLPYLEFADSEKIRVGQTAITIGYALGEFDNTVSKGVVSGLSRSIVASRGFGYRGERLYNLIQTDAAINLGNSGGPMLNIEGKVIGVNVAMAQAENIGFAIPGNEAKKAFVEVKETGIISKQEMAFLGVRYITINPQIKEANRLDYDYGALVIRGQRPEELAVMPGSPADRAGILENDIILEFDGIKISDRLPLYEIIRNYQPGDEVSIKLFSKGEEKEISIILGAN